MFCSYLRCMKSFLKFDSLSLYNSNQGHPKNIYGSIFSNFHRCWPNSWQYNKTNDPKWKNSKIYINYIEKLDFWQETHIFLLFNLWKQLKIFFIHKNKSTQILRKRHLQKLIHGKMCLLKLRFITLLLSHGIYRPACTLNVQATYV